jgi:hypothetical protein
MNVTRVSMVSGIEHTLDVPCTQAQLHAWACQGVLIQVARPDVPAPLREFVKTGITPEEWTELFKPAGLAE